MGIEKRGFASMTPERKKEIARLGGKAAHRKRVAPRYDSERGRAAALKRWGKK